MVYVRSCQSVVTPVGLLLFLAEVGTSAGKNLVATFQESGLLLFGVGATITVVPMLVAVVVGRLVFKISLLDLLGTITGGMTSTPGLAAADSMVDSNIPSVAHATVYPIAMVFPYFVYTSDRFGGLLIYQTAGWVCAKVVNTLAHFFIWMNVVFLFIDMRRKNIHFVSFIDFNLYICHNLNVIRRKIRLIQ